MPSYFGHGLKGEFAGVLELVLQDLFRFFFTAPLDFFHLGFEDLQRLIVSAAPSHEKVKEFIRIAVDLL